MKNLKKVLALVVVFAMMVSSVAFAAIYPDVATDADYAKAVSVLSDLGMIKGDDKGNFNPDATITRAEFATIVTRLLGVESAATGKANFADVAADHWATGYIAMAQQQGIISGYGDGNFGPENPVKYEEAVKMLVCALGYEQMAVSKGGWVAGYLTTAYQIGLLEDVSGTQGAGAPRSLVAQLSYNALDIPMMEQTGFGTDVKYEIMKKTDDHDKVTLLTKMGSYKLGGTILANEKVNYFGESVAEKGYIDFLWTDNYDCPAKDFRDEAGEKSFLVGETDVADSIGNNIIVYVKKTSTKYEVLAYEIDESSSSMTIKSKDLDGDVDWTNGYIKYYKDGATKSSKINLDTVFNVVENNQLVPWTEVEGEEDEYELLYDLGENSSATIEFVDFNDNNKYDIIKVTKYTHVIVDEVDAAKGRITDLNGDRVEFDLDDEEAIVSITDKNGNALELKDIAEGDVLAIVVVPEDGYTTAQALKSAHYESLDIIVLRDSFVTGKASGETEEGDIIIADVEYANSGLYDSDEIEYGSEGKFWIGIDGETIVGFEGETVKSGAYAYIADAWFGTINKENKGKVTLEVVTKDGFKEYEVANKISFVNELGKEYKHDVDEAYVKETVTIEVEEEEVEVDVLANTMFATLSTEEANLGKSLEAYFGDTAVESAADAKKRIVKVEINSSNEISKIVPLMTVSTNTYDDEEFIYYANGEAEWKADDLKLGTKMLAENAVVIEIDADYPEKMSFKDLGYFVDECKYEAILLDVDEDGYYAAAVVYGSDSVYPEADPVAIVKSVTKSMNEDGEDILKIKAVKAGEEIDLILNTEDDEVEKVYSTEYDDEDIALGTVMMFVADKEGNISKYSIVGVIDDFNGDREFDFDDGFVSAFPVDYDNGDTFVYGFIVENKNIARPNVKVLSDIVNEVDDDEDAETPVVKAFAKEFDTVKGFDGVLSLSVKNANQYTITGTKKSNAKIQTGDYTYGNVSAAYVTAEDDDEYEVYYVIARLFEGKVIDFIAIDTPEGSIWAAPAAPEAPVEAPAAPVVVAPVVEEKAEVKEEIVELEGFDL